MPVLYLYVYVYNYTYIMRALYNCVYTKNKASITWGGMTVLLLLKKLIYTLTQMSELHSVEHSTQHIQAYLAYA